MTSFREELFSNIINNQLDLRSASKELSLSPEIVDVLHKVIPYLLTLYSYLRKTQRNDLGLKGEQLK